MLGEKKRGTHLRLCKTKECDCGVCSNRSRIQHHSSRNEASSIYLSRVQFCWKVWKRVEYRNSVDTEASPYMFWQHVLSYYAVQACANMLCATRGCFLWIISSFSCIQQFQISKLLGHRVPCRTVTVSYFRSGPQGDIGPILSSEDTEGSEDMSRVKTAVTFHALNKNPSPLGVKASITAPANYHQSHPAMEAKRRKVGDVYPPRGNRFQDKVDPGQQSAAEQQLSKILWKSKARWYIFAVLPDECLWADIWWLNATCNPKQLDQEMLEENSHSFEELWSSLPSYHHSCLRPWSPVLPATLVLFVPGWWQQRGPSWLWLTC